MQPFRTLRSLHRLHYPPPSKLGDAQAQQTALCSFRLDIPTLEAERTNKYAFASESADFVKVRRVMSLSSVKGGSCEGGNRLSQKKAARDDVDCHRKWTKRVSGPNFKILQDLHQ